MRASTVVCVGVFCALGAAAVAGLKQDVLPSASLGVATWVGLKLGAAANNSMGLNSIAGSSGASWQYGSKKPLEVTVREIKEENDWKNDLVLWKLPDNIRSRLPRLLQSWIRNTVLCAAVYYGVGALWSYYIYFCFGSQLFRPGGIPQMKDTLEQMKVSSMSMPLYSLLPALTEYCVEKGWTLAYSRVSDVGGVWAYAGYFALYMLCVEFGVYWNHRNLHHPRVYKYLHVTHHKYNKEHTMSPFAGLAFNALDGIIQAIPYSWTLFFVPMHFLTHELLLFATGVWTINIHDNIHGKVFPIMGAMYHTIHHTLYKFNHGHYTVLFDWLFNTLLTPEEYEHQYPKAAALGRSKDH